MFGRDRIVRQYVRDRLVVTPKDGLMFSGVLLEVDSKSFLFTDVTVFEQSGSHSAAGVLAISRANVAYMQHVPQVAKAAKE